ncbi:MAG: MbnP family protein, partial [Bacteroidia bacterium]
MRLFIRQFVVTVFLAASNWLASCEKDPSIDTTTPPLPTAPTGSIEINLQAMFGDSLLVMNRGTLYQTANNDSVEVSLFKFYLSNIELTDVEGKRVVVPDSYFLCNADDGETMNFTLTGIPVGDYQEIKLMVGIDSARNVSGTQTGALDPANAMFWSWSSGYIFFKLEGSSPQSQIGGNSIVYHVGGYAGANRAQRTTSIYFGNTT